MSSTRRLGILSVFLLLALALAGCAQLMGPSDYSLDNTTKSTGATAPKAETSEAPESASTGGQTGQGTLPDSPKLIKTAEAVIEVEKGTFAKKYEDVKDIAERFDGHVTNASAKRVKGDMTSGTVTMRVPAKEFDNAIAAIRNVGTVDSLNIATDDVSEEYVDLESRLKNYQAQEVQLLNIMTKAVTVEETLKVQEQLTAVQGEIEVIKGRMQYLDNRVDFSTITITVQEPGAIVPSGDEWGFMDALRTGWKAFGWTINGIVVLFMAALPVIILIILAVYLIKLFIRLRRKGKK